MAYKWKPSKSQRKAFATKMQDPEEKKAYEDRKTAEAEKRRSGSQYNYNSAGGNYIPTREQHDFCFSYSGELTPEQRGAFNQVMYGYNCQEKVHHDYIHIVNELRRLQNQK